MWGIIKNAIVTYNLHGYNKTRLIFYISSSTPRFEDDAEYVIVIHFYFSTLS